MFLDRIVEWIDSLESGDQFRKWAVLSVKTSGIFTLVITFVLGIALLTLVLIFTRGSGIFAQTVAIIGTLFGLVTIGIVGITMAMLFWNRAEKIASLGEEHLGPFILADLTRLLGEVAFIGFSGAAILFLVCSIFGAMMLGWIVLVLLALSFLFYFLAGGFLQFSYVIADISTNIKQIEPTLSRDVTAATTPESVPADTPLQERPTLNSEEHAPESREAAATTAPELVPADTPLQERPTLSSEEYSPESRETTAATTPESVPADAPLQERPTPNNEERSPEVITEQDAETHTNGYPYPESEGRLGIVWRLFVTLLTCFIYGIFWKRKQMLILNGWLGRETYSIWRTIGLSALTCGIYNIYSEYQMARGINEARIKYGMQYNPKFPTIYMLFYFLTVSLGAYAIMQTEINKLYDEYPNG